MTQLSPDTDADADAARLNELGYRQELVRHLHGLDNAAIGFASISPVVGLYAVVLVGTLVAGPAWVWVLPVTLAGQCLLLAVYSELASEFPIAGGAYQWSRRLLGPAYGWLNGWVAVCAYAVANTTIAYLGAPWALSLAGIEPTADAVVLTGMALVCICALVGSLGIDVLRRAIKTGIAAEMLASIGIGLALLFAFRVQDLDVLTHSLGSSGDLLAALAVGGWVFIGFDACIGAAEETRSAAEEVPRAIWIALLSVGVLVILNAVAAMLAHPDLGAIVAGADAGPRRHRRRQLVRLVVGEAVRRARARRVPRLRHGRADGDRAHDLLDRAGRRAARLAGPARGRPARGARAARSASRRWSRASGCCSACTPRRSAA